jgi:hypothetical protein
MADQAAIVGISTPPSQIDRRGEGVDVEAEPVRASAARQQALGAAKSSS